jgi:hypothetical protein
VAVVRLHVEGAADLNSHARPVNGVYTLR